MANMVVALVHEEDGAFGISFPDFPGAVSGGDSIEEAMTRGAAALAFHVEGMVRDGEAIPVLRSLEQLRKDRTFRDDAKGAVAVGVPLDLPGKITRVNITMDENLLRSVDTAAESSGQTRSAFLADAVKRVLRGAA